jgi:anti-sigma B factor antagonist
MVSRDRVLKCGADGALTVTAESQGSTEILAVSGSVDVATTATLAGEIRDAIEAAPEIVVVDLSAVAFFAASGLSVLVEADGRARAAGCRLVVIAGDGPARQLFERTAAQQVLTIAS